MAVTSKLVTVAEFTRLPQPAAGIRQELHHGRVLELPPVKKFHTEIQRRLLKLLSASTESTQFGLEKEFPFRPAPEHEVWIADVAVFDLPLWEQTADDDYFRGVPAIVIEVLSPSNSTSEMLEREEICLGNGGQEFWLVDPQRQTVKAVHAGGRSRLYNSGQMIESVVLASSIAARNIFSEQ